MKTHRYLILLTVLAVLILSVIGISLIRQAEAYNAKELNGYIQGDLSIVEPKNNTVYTNVVPLNITQTTYGKYLGFFLLGNGYSYSIDGKDNVTLPKGMPPNKVFINLDEGDHCIVAYSSFAYSWGQLAGPYEYSSEPVYFSVIKTTDTQISPAIHILIISIVSAAIIGIMIILSINSNRKKR
jgi:hypothetical protein